MLRIGVVAIGQFAPLLIWLLILGGESHAAPPFKPAILFDTNVLFDGGFTESAYRGAKSFTEIKGVDVKTFSPGFQDKSNDDVDYPRIIRDALAAKHSPLIGVGYGFTDEFSRVAPKYPETKFILVDAVIDAPNVQSIIFREEQGSYLVGAMAAMASKTGKIGFVGGQDLGLIRNFGCGYSQGANRANPKIEIITAMIGDDVSAFVNPRAGKVLAQKIIAAGADVIYHAAGLSGNGVIEAAAQAGVLAIGVDSNQNAQAPGHVLTSMLKRLDVAIYRALLDLDEGRWYPGTQHLGLTEGAIGWSLDENNIELVSQDMQDHVENQAFEIMTNRVRVAVYDDEEGCPVADPVKVDDWGIIDD
ncbi:BMP family protein [Magnetospira sp. QH-2]|uniref:BMP family lipoprotein n=1 Tax=Magnetospira sp. (strain QH-2) TaxID=1288970 RepID=UPI0003E818F5|nr:BMP family ABC transporter substrate-binding protein [Magnetospira sp. QH-2]CCQ73767.1 Membrane lipoprotein [Magnetospira sp. QH-2]